MTLTAEQSQLVEDNIKLAYKCFNKFKDKYSFLEEEAIYDCCIEGIVNSARLWDKDKGSFSTLVFIAAERNVLKHIKYLNNPKRKGFVQSLDDTLGDERESVLERFFGQEDEYRILDRDFIERCFSVLSKKEQGMVYRYFFLNETQKEVGDHYNCDKRLVNWYVQRAIVKMRKFQDRVGGF